MKRRLFLAGCWAMILTGAIHTFAQAMNMAPKGKDATETQLLQLMQTYRDAGTGRTTMEMLIGFSLLFSIFCFAIGFLGLASAKGGGLNLLVMRFNTILLGSMLAISLIYFFFAPTTCLGIAFALFAAALAMKE